MSILTPIRKAVVVAAGKGRRLAPYTDEMPKCLVPVRGRPMLARQLDAFRAHGVVETVVVRGYKADVLERRRSELGPGVRFVENLDYERNNILSSLFKAESELDGPFLFTYADIVFAQEVVGELLSADGDICLIIDQDFAKVYDGRTDHPLAEAEVCALSPSGHVAAVGKRSIPPHEAFGEFIGLAKFSARGATMLLSAWRKAKSEYVGREDAPFMRAPRFQEAYLTDLLQFLIDEGVPLTPVPIRGRWREIDTVQDLRRAEDSVDW
ncbi:MAG: phosphocholine cytidylyltransferase family protein [Deltaproteobacteria bacterium]|nr:phosphocholine cytidylyltransferase family protein [Deltaproteobacteria bacterium]